MLPAQRVTTLFSGFFRPRRSSSRAAAGTAPTIAEAETPQAQVQLNKLAHRREGGANAALSFLPLSPTRLSAILLIPLEERSNMSKQRILLVDDHEVVRLGLKALLERHPNFEVIGEAGSAREAIELVGTLQPSVVVMDIRLPGTSGIEACEEIVQRFPETKVLMLTSYAEDEMLFSAIRAGASGYILKQIGGEELMRALEAVGRGEALLDPAVTQRVFQEVRKAVKEEEASAFAHLSQQEKHVLLLVSEGKTNREIAKALFLGEGTVRNYVSSILSKLGVNNRAEAAAYAVEHNLKEYIQN
jgi:two-component system, NarL family, response regulator DevR